MSAALARAVQAGEVGAAGRAHRVEVLVALAIAVNWTARVAGGRAAQQLARSARTVIAEWRLP
jgi:hypothetical protein